VSLAACQLPAHGGEAENLTITLAARYTAVYAAAQQPGPCRGWPVTEMRRSKVRARSNSGGAVRFNFILPIKEDA
jgi:hypothetical protein